LRPTGESLWSRAACYAGRLYFCGSNGPIKAFTLGDSVLSPQTLANGNLNQSAESYMGQIDENGKASATGGCTPVVSSNADAAGTGVVWAITRHGPQVLRAYDTEDLTTVLFEGQAGTWNNPHGAPFNVPTVIEGKVYVGTADHLAVFGL
jgi:hypothetical protein